VKFGNLDFSDTYLAGPISTTDTWYQLDKKLAAVACFKRLDINIHYKVQNEWGVALRSHIARAFEHWIPENAFPILSISQTRAILSFDYHFRTRSIIDHAYLEGFPSRIAQLQFNAFLFQLHVVKVLDLV